MAAILVSAGAVVPSTSSASAAEPSPAKPPAQDDGLTRSIVPPASRAALLPKGWATSSDVAWTTTSDANGFHLLMAAAADAYAWRTVATLREPGFETDRWVGNACLTESGTKAVVVYAPRDFTNKEQLFDRGAYTAVVDVSSGAVTKLPIRASIAYFDPGCGVGERAVVTQARGENDPSGKPVGTRLASINAGTAKVTKMVELAGQVTSAIPVANGEIAAAQGNSVIALAANGARRQVASTSGVPFRLAPDAAGGVVFLDESDRDVKVKRLPNLATSTSAVELASGPKTQINLRPGAHRQIFVTGQPTVSKQLPSGVHRADVPATAELSTAGDLAILHDGRQYAPPAKGQEPSAGFVASMTDETAGDADHAADLDVRSTILSTGKNTSFVVTPGVRPTELIAGGSAPSPLSGSATVPKRAAALSSSPTDTVDTDAWCSVPRNDPRTQVYQPTPRQVEWAANQAVVGNLLFTRPANWKESGLSAYQPQGLFPPIALTGGGRVPTQIFLGILSQESNLWQASGLVQSGSTGNPLIGNYYGRKTANADTTDDWIINFADSDCGYGISQITDGMRKPEHPKPNEVILSATQQRAAALDYTANIAGGLRILQSKWNQLKSKGMLPDGNYNSKWLESWFLPVWAYNSGLQPSAVTGSTSGCDPSPSCTDPKGNWGLGWGNNPVNPKYDPNRPFFNADPHDAAHPQDWPYPEKIIGWAAYSIATADGPGFRPAWWVTAADRLAAKPPRTWFCMPSANHCDPSQSVKPNDPDVSGEPAGPCVNTNTSGLYDLHCWWHETGPSYRDCSQVSCGNELLRFDTTYPEQPDGTHNEPNCSTAGLPAGAMVIDELADGIPSVRRKNDGTVCQRPATQGTFKLEFTMDAHSSFPSKVDFHQRGAGFGGHLWYGFTHEPGVDGNIFGVKGTWKLNGAINGPAQVLVHVPDTGSEARVIYNVKTANGVRSRTLNQASTTNRWASLGAFMFNAAPEVTLSNLLSGGGSGDKAIAWDAVAIAPTVGTYAEHTVEADAVFDENQNVDTAAPAWLAGPLANRQTLYDWGNLRSSGLTALPECSQVPTSGCSTAEMRNLGAAWNAEIVRSGTDPVNHPAGSSIARWIRFAQPYTDRPTSPARPASFDDFDHFKIKSKATVSFVYAPTGKIVAGSEWVEYENRTGNTHLPTFVTDLFKAVQNAYGIAPPDLSFSAADLNIHNGASTYVNPVTSGTLPGRAYAYAGTALQPFSNVTPTDWSNANCVLSHYVSGGSIGYRPMLGFSGPSANFQAWVNKLKNDIRVSLPVSNLAQDLFDMFFNRGSVPAANASIFSVAPPIWQELFFLTCSDGSIRQYNSAPLLRSSWMPDQYLYHNGTAILANGNPSSDGQAWIKGRFDKFSSMPVISGEHPFGDCDANTDRSGNPWNISPTELQDAGVNPAHAHFCENKNDPIDPAYSS